MIFQLFFSNFLFSCLFVFLKKDVGSDSEFYHQTSGGMMLIKKLGWFIGWNWMYYYRMRQSFKNTVFQDIKLIKKWNDITVNTIDFVRHEVADDVGACCDPLLHPSIISAMTPCDYWQCNMRLYFVDHLLSKLNTVFTQHWGQNKSCHDAFSYCEQFLQVCG